MIYNGNSIQADWLDDNIANLVFDRKDLVVNKFDEQTVSELSEATQALSALDNLQGVVVSSNKKVFIAGADITEFTALFRLPSEDITAWAININRVFSAFEDLPVPTVAAINGAALGGGLEMALCCDYRVAAPEAILGFPEVGLGLIPGFGGTVRAPRVIGVTKAIEWITSGKPAKPQTALDAGMISEICGQSALVDAAKAQLSKGKLAVKNAVLNPADAALCVSASDDNRFTTQAAKGYPAPLEAAKTLAEHALLPRDEAVAVEAKHFGQLAKTDSSAALVGLFLNEQAVKKQASKWRKAASKVEQAAVLGAGIMGGGIAQQSASRGTPILMKDIAQPALDLGMSEAQSIVNKGVKRGKLTDEQAEQILSKITPQLDYQGFENVDLVVEAVVENPTIKTAVLTELQTEVSDDAILASNTSTISINAMAASLKRPQNFLGMHFFNPVHAMQLVEVIKGKDTSDAAIATTVGYAAALGKSPIVVNDCPGFLVNRVLFPYIGACSQLISEGVSFEQIDQAMETFGWPMGPAYLSDVVGLDTCSHAAAVMAQGFPDRMQYNFTDAIDVLFAAGLLGQKNGTGFYTYSKDANGRPNKTANPEAVALIKQFAPASKTVSDTEIVERLMLAFCTESIRCLEDSIVDTAAEVDMAMLLGVGFPRFRGGPLRYADTLGAQTLVELSQQYSHLGAVYEAPTLLLEQAKTAQGFFD